MGGIDDTHGRLSRSGDYLFFVVVVLSVCSQAILASMCCDCMVWFVFAELDPQSGDKGRGRNDGGGGAGDGSDVWDDSGRQSRSSQGAGGVSSRSGSRILSARSRPGSTRGPRPGSSMRKHGRGLEHRDRSRRDDEV